MFFWRIVGPVGRWENGAVNNPTDVAAVEELLKMVSDDVRDPRLDPRHRTGMVVAETIEAIEAFQQRMEIPVDGCVCPDCLTWFHLRRAAEESALHHPRGPFFPLAKLPTEDWASGMRAFGSNRSGGKRAHAACDLYAPKGTPIYAIADGTVVQKAYYFYCETYALEVDHGEFVARYGEIQAKVPVKAGQAVKAGQRIASVGHLQGITVPSDMLHLELYDKSQTGKLSVPAAAGRKRADGIPFLRRKDLIDPTEKLRQWKGSLPRA